MWETAVKKQEKSIYDRGMEKGMEKGEEKAKMEDARRMIAKGMDNALIRDITGLSIKQFQALRNK